MRTRGSGRRAAVGVAIALLAGACASPAGDEAGGDGLHVVASFYPLAAAARIVGGAHVVVENLTPPGVEPHDLELVPTDLEAIQGADLVVIVGGGFQPAIEEGVADAAGVVLDALEGARVLPPPDGDAGDELSADPHVWLDPRRYAAFVDRLADALSDLSPGEASSFSANAETYVGELESLDAELADGLATCERRLLVVNHAAFGYLADAYGLEQVAISGVSPEAEPDPDRLAELAELVRREGVTTIFTEELASPEVARTLADEAGVGTAVLNPLEGLTPGEVEAGEDYRSIMRANLDALRRGLGCA